MTSKGMLRGLWIAAAGACIALGAGHGVAAAETDSSDGGAGPSSSVQSSESSPSSSATQSVASKESDKSQDSAGGSKVVDKPTSTVSASTVTVKRDEIAAPAPVEKVTTEPAKSAQSAEAVAPEPVAAPPKKVVEDVEQAKDVEPVKEVEPVKDAEPASAATPITPPVATPRVARESAAVTVTKDVATFSALAAPVAARPQPGPIATVVISLLSAFGLMPSVPAVPANVVGVNVPAVPGTSAIDGVTGVKVGSSNLSIPVGTGTYTGAADWYFPTQADGTVQAQGVTWLQHGFLGSKSWYSALAQDLAQRTNSIVVVPNIPSFPFFTCGGCSLNDVPIQQGVADLFVDPNRTALTASAEAAGYHGVLPDKFILTGHSAGGGLAAAAGGFYAAAVNPAVSDLLGVVMFDGVSSNGTFAPAVASLKARNIPVYQIAAPPQPWNANGQTTKDLVQLLPGQFVGATLANGSHVDSLIGGSPIIDFLSQLLIRQSPPGNTQAVYTLAAGWINDFYAGRGPADPVYGTYGDSDQYVMLGPTAAVVLGPAPVVDVNRYLGTWYEVGSVKQFFSIGLVNTTAVYSPNPDGTIRVENSGNYFFDDGPKSTIVGAATPLNAENNKLNVTFFGPPSAAQPGNYWIVDLAPDYSWAVVSDSTGGSGFLLSRTRTVSDDLYQELLNRASVQGVTGSITRTPQPAAARQPIAV